MVSGHAPWDVPTLTASEALACSMAQKQKRSAEAQMRRDAESHQLVIQQLSRSGERGGAAAAAEDEGEQIPDLSSDEDRQDEGGGAHTDALAAATRRRGSDAAGASHRAVTPLAASASALHSATLSQRRSAAQPRRASVTLVGLRRSATEATRLGGSPATPSPSRAPPAVEPWNGTASLSVLGAINRRAERADALSRPMAASAVDLNAARLPHDIDASIARIARSRGGRLGRGPHSLSSSILPAIGPAARLPGSIAPGNPAATVEVLSAVVHNAVGGDAEEAIKIIDEASEQGRRSRARASGGARAKGGPGGSASAEGGAGGKEGGARVDRPLAQVRSTMGG